MPNDLIIPVEVQTTTTEPRGVTLKEMTLLAGTPAQPGVLAIVLASKDEAGNFRPDGSVLMRKTDEPENPDPRQAQAASMFHELMFSAIVSHTPVHRAMGVAGLSVWDAAKVILGQELS